MLVGGVTLAVGFGTSTLRAASVIDNWASVKAPSAPELKPIQIDPKTTALLMLDYVKQICNAQRYPNCPARLPTVKKLLDQARANGVMVVYTGTTIPPSERTDIDPMVAPTGDEWILETLDGQPDGGTCALANIHGLMTLGEKVYNHLDGQSNFAYVVSPIDRRRWAVHWLVNSTNEWIIGSVQVPHPDMPWHRGSRLFTSRTSRDHKDQIRT